jgi:hypothetical protein
MNPAAEARTSDATLVVLAEEIDDAIFGVYRIRGRRRFRIVPG